MSMTDDLMKAVVPTKELMTVNTVIGSSNVIGLRVKSLRSFSGVPKGSEGVIDEVYMIGDHRGVTVAWDLPDQPLPKGYCRYDGKPAFASGILRDGFGQDETEYLEVIYEPNA